MRNRGAWRKVGWVILATLALGGAWMGAMPESTGKVEKPSTSILLHVGMGSVSASPSPSPSHSEEFARVSTEVANSLPTIAVLREEIRNDPHRTPPALLAAGAELGHLVRLIQEHPELKRDGTEFYRKCSFRDELPSSIRALCYSNLMALSKMLGEDRTQNSAQVPEDIRELSEKLPSSFR